VTRNPGLSVARGARDIVTRMLLLRREILGAGLALLGSLSLAGCSDEPPPAGPTSFSRGSTRAARQAAEDVVNECESRGFRVQVKRGGTACRHWIHYEVHCKESSVSNFARLACDEQDDFCARLSEVCDAPE
jgi:hypothetical protein